MLEKQETQMKKKEIVLSDSSVYYFYYFDIWEVIEDMLLEVPYINFDYQELRNEGKSCYSEVWTGEWWKKTERQVKKLNEATKLLGVILYSDKTHLTHKNTQHAHPVNLSLGNFTQNQRSKKEGRKDIIMLSAHHQKIFPQPGSKSKIIKRNFPHMHENSAFSPQGTQKK